MHHSILQIMKNKTVIITGATNGIGKAAAEALANKGAHLVLVGRNPQKAENVKREIIQKTANSNIDILIADLSSMAQVKRLGQEILEKYPKIDVLLNNAGAFFQERQETVDGFELTFALNHLAYFLLTRDLLDRLKANPDGARIVNVSSAAQNSGKINFDDLMMEQDYTGFKSYCASKLANVMFTYELARRLEGTKVTTNAVHPGAVSTGFGAETSGFMSFLLKLFKPFMIKPAKGAETPIYLASSPEVEGITGKYWAKKRAEKTTEQSYNKSDCARLWSESEKLVASF